MAESGDGNEKEADRLSRDTLLPEPADGAPAPRPSPSNTGKYEVAATLGKGGMGEVLLVRDRDLGREVAMKVMKGALAGVEEHRARFVAEAQATSQLEHPGIPPVHDIGVTPEGSPFFTMKVVRGGTLRSVLDGLAAGKAEVEREYTLHRLVTVLERICETVHFSHEKGVIHRDLKP